MCVFFHEPTGAFYGNIRFVETSDEGYRPIIVDDNGREVGNLNTSLVSSLKLSIIMAIVSANKIRNYTSFYPLITDAPISDFDTVKSMTFLREVANTFNQSIVIIKEVLVEDPIRKDRYKPDLLPIKELFFAFSETKSPFTELVCLSPPSKEGLGELSVIPSLKTH